MMSYGEFYEYRDYLYYLTALIALLWSMAIIEVRNDKFLYKGGSGLTLVLVLALMLLVGFRSRSVGVDVRNYFYLWDGLNSYAEITSDYLFYYLMYFIKSTTGDFQMFLLAVSVLFFIPFYLAMRNFSKFFNCSAIFFFFMFASFFFLYSASTNVLRQGVAITFLFYAYSVFLTQKGKWRWIKMILAILVAYFFHSTSLIPIGVMIGSIFAVNIKLIYYYFFYIIGILASAAGVGIQMLGEDVINLDNRDRSIYFDDNAEDLVYTVGFKLKFVIFNTIFLIIFHNLLKLMREKDPKLAYYYKYLMIYYIVSSVVFYMFFQVKFSDRVGLYPWFAIPILMSPIFSNKVRIGTLRILGVFFFATIFFAIQF